MKNIINPINKEIYSIYSNKGKNLLKEYILFFRSKLQNGGGVQPIFYYKTDNFYLVKVIFDKLPKFDCKLKFTPKKYLFQPKAAIFNKKLYGDIETKKSDFGWKKLYSLCKNKTFTYCLKINEEKTQTHLYLCETGPTKMHDDRCKHGFLGKYAGVFKETGVCCAGVCVFKSNMLYLDDKSGTYTPSINNLKNARKFLKNNLTKNIEIVPITKEITTRKKNKWCSIFLDSPDRKKVKCNYNKTGVINCLDTTKTKENFLKCIKKMK